MSRVTRVSTLVLGSEVSSALSAPRAVVALESSVFAQGLPEPASREAADRMRDAVRSLGAVPAITGVVNGRPIVGLGDDDLERFLRRNNVAKVSAKDLPWAMAQRKDGATTVAAAIALAALAGVAVFATGGIGGVHREPVYDESADLVELSRTPIIVVCAGAKSILNVPATAERLETLGVPVIGYRTSEWPGFYAVGSGIPIANRVESVDEIVAQWRAHRALGMNRAFVVMNPVPAAAAIPAADVETALASASDRARRNGIAGAAITPYLLSEIAVATGGRTLRANVELLVANAGLAAEIAVKVAS